jgi:hypothetical protein
MTVIKNLGRHTSGSTVKLSHQGRRSPPLAPPAPMADGCRGLPVAVRNQEEIQDKIINQQKSWSQKQKVGQ